MQSAFLPQPSQMCYNKAVQPKDYTLFSKRNTKSLALRTVPRYDRLIKFKEVSLYGIF